MFSTEGKQTCLIWKAIPWNNTWMNEPSMPSQCLLLFSLLYVYTLWIDSLVYVFQLSGNIFMFENLHIHLMFNFYGCCKNVNDDKTLKFKLIIKFFKIRVSSSMPLAYKLMNKNIITNAPAGDEREWNIGAQRDVRKRWEEKSFWQWLGAAHVVVSLVSRKQWNSQYLEKYVLKRLYVAKAEPK
jgi:hypothetical protein